MCLCFRKVPPQERGCFWHSETAGASAGNPETLFKKTPATGKAAGSEDVKKAIC